jgi:hypothetical protein
MLMLLNSLVSVDNLNPKIRGRLWLCQSTTCRDAHFITAKRVCLSRYHS